MELNAASWNLPPMGRLALFAFLILVMPYVTRRLRVPAIVGFILAGVLVGPHGLSIVPKHAHVAEFFADLGKLLLMFFAGLEIDMRQFRANQSKAIVFGLATFSLPLATGIVVGLVFGYSVVSAVLIGSLLASHTLIAYPLVLSAGLAGRPAITITVGATILTDMLALLVLAVCVTTHLTGFSPLTLAIQVGELVAFVLFMIAFVGPMARRLFERLGKSEELSFALMLGIVAMGASVAEALHIEGILGAFLAGLAVNEAVRDSAAKEKIEFLGNTMFIPAFFIVTGFLVDLQVFGLTLWTGPGLVLAIVLGLVASKWLAAEAVGRIWRFSAVDRGLMASLTQPQVAATLAAALVSYQAVNKAGERLIDTAMLNTVLVLVVVTSVLGPVLVQRYIRLANASAPEKAVPHSVLGRGGIERA